MNLKVVVSRTLAYKSNEVSFGAIAALYNEAQTLANDGFDVLFTHNDKIVIKVSKVFDPTGRGWLDLSKMFRDIANYEKLGFTAKYE